MSMEAARKILNSNGEQRLWNTTWLWLFLVSPARSWRDYKYLVVCSRQSLHAGEQVGHADAGLVGVEEAGQATEVLHQGRRRWQRG